MIVLFCCMRQQNSITDNRSGYRVEAVSSEESYCVQQRMNNEINTSYTVLHPVTKSTLDRTLYAA